MATIKQTEPYLIDKRNEFIFSLIEQKYNMAQIGRIFNISRARVHIIARGMPANYKSPWIKREDKQ